MNIRAFIRNQPDRTFPGAHTIQKRATFSNNATLEVASDIVGMIEDNGGSLTPVVLTPVISPSGGMYSSPQEINITCGTSGATIYYTLDGSTPTTSSSVFGLSSIIVSTPTTVKAMAVATGYSNSDVVSATYAFSGVSLTGEFVGYGWGNLVKTTDNGHGVNISNFQDGGPLEEGGTPVGAYGTDLVSTSSPFEVDVEIDTNTAPLYRNVSVQFVPENTSGIVGEVPDLQWGPPSNSFAISFYVDDSDNIVIQLVNNGTPNQVSAGLLSGNVIIRFHGDGTDTNNNLVVSMSNDNFASSVDLGTYSIVNLMGEDVIVKLIYLSYALAGQNVKVSYRAS